MYKNLALNLVRVTESAALAAGKFLGKGLKEAGDGAAVDAMRKAFGAIDISGRVVIGEGENDKAPMLFNGERVGNGNGLEMDLAVDPVEGTNLLARGRANAIAVVGASPSGTMYDPGPSFYMKKIVCPKEAASGIDIDAPVKDNLLTIAKAVGKTVDELVVFVLEKPRHRQLIADIRKTGACIQLHTDGDVAGSLMAADPSSEVDVMMGTGGTPEGVISACAIRALGGWMIARLAPQSEEERCAVAEYGKDMKEILTVESLIKSRDAFFAATGISGGTFLRGVKYAKKAVSHSMVINGNTGTVRWITSHHPRQAM
ncbi:MAG: class II fructose-bisphosphatase [Desulfobacteraceae bacterium]|nr:class II fructose-bisphosphatase [Desulfobacteraceae bacterium]